MLQITNVLKNELKNPNVETTLVAIVDGIETLFTNVKIKKPILIGDPDLYIGDDWVIGGYREVPNQKDLLMMSGSTTKITQKTDPSKGIGTSISQMNLLLLDLNAEITKIVSPGQVVPDIIGRRITIMTGAKETGFPLDYVTIYRGQIQELGAEPNTVLLNLSNTDEKKRVAVLPKVTTVLTDNFDYRSATFQDILYRNREDVVNSVSVTYIAGGTAGSEVVSLTGPYAIQVQIQNGVSTASQIRKAIENDDDANQLVEAKITGDSSNGQSIGSATLGVDLTASIESASEFITPTDTVETYFICQDELVQYTGKTTNTLTGLTRGQRSSIPAFAETEEKINQVILFRDHGINIALKLMLSQGPTYYIENLKIDKVNQYSFAITRANTVFFENVDVKQKYGITVGDFFTSTGSTIPANNVVDAVVLEIGLSATGSYIVLSATLTDDPSPAAMVCKFKSKYNVYPIGLGMLPSEVDIAQHEYIRDTFIPVFSMALPVDEIMDCKDFLEEQIYKTMSCLSVTRNGQSSIVYVIAPLPTTEVPILDLESVENPDALKVRRSINENFINQVQFDYDYDIVNTKFKSHKNLPETADIDRTRIDVGPKPFIISAQGLNTEDDITQFMSESSEKYLNRYKYGAEFIKGIQLAFSVGYALEIGDIVAVDYTALKLSNFDNGTRAGALKLMEIVNKSFDIRSKQVVIDVVNTAFGFGDRFGVISPATLVDTGSTTTRLAMQKSWSTLPFQLESTKWVGYEGQNIVVRDEEFNFIYKTKIRGFDSLTPQGMIIDPVPTAPQKGWIIEPDEYPDDIDPRVEEFWKIRHAYASPTVVVVAGVSTTQFTVGAGDVAKFNVGALVRVHNYAFTIDSPEVKVKQVTGLTIEVESSLGFVPDNTMFVDLIGFADSQPAYRVV